MQKGDEKKIEATAEAIKKLGSISDFRYHKMSPEETTMSLSTNLAKGLGDAEATKRLSKYGHNELEKEEETSLWEKIKEQFEDLLARILLLAATISFVIAITGDGEEGISAYVEPFVILLILILNALVAIYQDNDADSALEALKDMQAIECQVKRNGAWKTLDSKLLVPGDIVRVKMGDNVPADLRILELNSVSLMVGEAPLTGESQPVQKQVEQLSGGSDILQDQTNMLFSSTIVNYGSAVGVVVFTGMQTAIGRVQKQVSEAAQEEEDTPLKKKLDDFGEKLSYMIGAVCLLVWVMNYANFYDDIHGGFVKGCIYYFKIAIALAVAAIPEGLPAVITTCLALGTRKMAQNNAIVRRLPSVETLGCTTVICSDKTGTLTKNQMSVVKFAVIDTNPGMMQTINVKEASNAYSPVGCKIDCGKADIFDAIGACCTTNNNSRIDLIDGRFERVGLPTEAALKVFAEKLCGDPKSDSTAFTFEQKMKQQIHQIAQMDFTSERKAQSTIVTGFKDAEKTTFLIGAPERIIKKCTKFMNLHDDTVEMTGDDIKDLQAKAEDFASEGLRCVAVAMIPNAGNLSDLTHANKMEKLKDLSKYEHYESGGTFLGIVCIKDPVRPEVKPAIKQCKTAGIRVIMITGDSKSTAMAIARELNIVESHQDESTCCHTGAEFGAMTEKQRRIAVGGEAGKVFSRVEPQHKREIVKALIELGHVVAMTGDGVNDAPALKQAHIGIAMGQTGTEVAKLASDMVLADDNFASIVKAVEEGRSIYSNMKAFIRYLISSNIGEVLSIFMTAMLGIPEGFTSVQLLWVNLVTDGPPATALGFNPPDIDIMRKPPRKQDDNLISGWVLVRYVIIGFYVGAATVGIFIYWYLYAETGDGHTLVSWAQLSNWSECPSWPAGSFQPVNFIEGLDFSKNPCTYFTTGKIKASTLSLSVLVMIEMLNSLNAISEDNSLLTMSPFVNPYLLLAIAGSVGLHMMIVYVPFFAKIFGITAMNSQEWILVMAFSAPVILVDEVLKVFGRQFNEAELQARMSLKEKKNK